MICYCCSNCCRASVVTSLTVSPISCKPPSLSVIWSSDILVAFDFFLEPPFYHSLGCLIRENLSCGSTPCSLSVSSFVSGEGDCTPLLEPPIFFAIYWATSCSTWALSMPSFFLISASWVILSLASCFFLYATDLLPPNAKSIAVCHSTSH